MPSSSAIRLELVWFLINLSLSTSILHVVVSASTSSHQYVSFSLTHRDAESSPLKSLEADPTDLPEDMPLRAFVAAGRALRKRLDKQSKLLKARKRPLVGKTSYAGDMVGDFYLTVPVGTPSQNIVFLLDTGSEFTWVHCSPCVNCTNTTALPFAYHLSSSLLAVASYSYLCTSSVGLETSHTGRTLCRFREEYADGSVANGFFAIDSFHLGFSKSSFIFGCANVVQETGSIQQSAGTMGLDAGPFSFTSQLFASNPDMPKKFAYCLPDRLKNLNTPGRIEFGNYKQPKKARYTPLAPPYSPLGNLFYYVKLEGIAVGGTLIKVESMDADQRVMGGGTIFDSGAGQTHLVKPVYDKMVREVERQTAHLKPFNMSTIEDGVEYLCYHAPLIAKKPPDVPRITMHFAGRAQLKLVPGSILRPFSIIPNTSSVFCLAFLSTEGTLNIIGNYQQQNYWVEYNLETSSLGLAKANCANYQ